MNFSEKKNSTLFSKQLGLAYILMERNNTEEKNEVEKKREFKMRLCLNFFILIPYFKIGRRVILKSRI